MYYTNTINLTMDILIYSQNKILGEKYIRNKHFVS
jgi:hypothetical protein